MREILKHQEKAYYADSASATEVPQPPFAGALFPCLIWDHVGGSDTASKKAFAQALIRGGCRYAVCAGTDAQSWHDAFDLAREEVSRGMSEEAADREFVMTSWHDRESVEDTAFFFAFNTVFDDHDFTKYLVVHFGGSESERLRVDEAVRREVLGEAAA